MPAAEPKAPMVIRIPPELREAIKVRAAEEDRSMAQTIRHALKQYLRSKPA